MSVVCHAGIFADVLYRARKVARAAYISIENKEAVKSHPISLFHAHHAAK